MKTKETDQDSDNIETTQLAAFGALVGVVMTVFLFLALVMGSISGSERAGSSEVKPQVEAPVEPPQPAIATTAPQRQPAIVDAEQFRRSQKSTKPQKRRPLNPSALRTSVHNKDYKTSVVPGQTPKMIQVQ